MSEEKLEEINTIAEFMEKLNKVKEFERYKNLKKGKLDDVEYEYSIDLFYRGHSDNRYELVPSSSRQAKNIQFSVSALEVALINKAKNEYPVLFSETDNPLDLLVKLQHYGIPTRLLDITTNPLVALYFACINNFNVDGEIFIFGNQYETYFDNTLSHDIARYMGRSDIFAANIITIEEFYIELLTRKQQNTSSIDNYIMDNNGDEILKYVLNSLYFIYPPRLFERLHLQQGHFILFLNDYKYDEVKQILRLNNNLSHIPKEHKNIIARYIIPAKSKKHLLEELKMLNITESTLFHDDVDRVCRNIVADFKGRYGK